MAKSKKKESSKGTKDKDKSKSEADLRAEDLARLKEQIAAGKDISKDLGMEPGFMGRVDDTLPSYGADPNILNRGELLARLRSESFQGGYNTPEQDAYLRMMGDYAGSSGMRTADTADVIARRRAGLDTAGNIDPQLSGVQGMLRNEYDRSRTVAPDVQLALDTARAGLGGLNSEESRAFQENATAGTNRAFTGATRSMAGAGLASGAGINPAMAQALMRDYGDAQFGARNALVMENANLTDARLGNFSNLARGVDTDLYGRAQDTLGRYGDYTTAMEDLSYRRRQDALGLYESSVSGAETDEFNRGAQARSQYAGAVEANVNNNRTDRLARLNNYQNELNTTLADNFQRVTTNINTNAAELSARTGTILGIPSYLEGVDSARKANELAKKQIEQAGGSKLLGGGGGGGGSGGGGGGSAASDGDSFDTPSSKRSIALGSSL